MKEVTCFFTDLIHERLSTLVALNQDKMKMREPLKMYFDFYNRWVHLFWSKLYLTHSLVNIQLVSMAFLTKLIDFTIVVVEWSFTKI